MVLLAGDKERGLVDESSRPGRQQLPIAINVAVVVERIAKAIFSSIPRPYSLDRSRSTTEAGVQVRAGTANRPKHLTPHPREAKRVGTGSAGLALCC